MKKYSADYFEKKYKILFDKLIIKEGFIDDIKKTRKELGIPVESGFAEISHLAEFIMKKLTKSEQRYLAFSAFTDRYNRKKGEDSIAEGHKEELIDAFMEETNGMLIPLDVMVNLCTMIDDHTNLFTARRVLSENKKLSKFNPAVHALFKKFFNVDLLDFRIAICFIETYLFLGEKGIQHYIRKKISCPNCRYIGVDHFSPNRNHMEGQDEGPFSKKYIFNKSTVKQLSSYFDSVFIIVKPYATKEQVLNYIADNWDSLKEHVIQKNQFYKQWDVKPGEIKESNTRRNKFVYELYKLPKKELLKKYAGTRNLSLAGIYKESIISAILEEQYDLKMTPDAIKKCATRFAKSINIKKEPRDIGDI
jgi:hypothetical protein